MTHRGACASRWSVARAPGFEWLEDRWLLSSVPAPAGSQWAGLAVEASSIPLFVARGSMAAVGDPLSSGRLGEILAGEPGSSTATGGLRIEPPRATVPMIGPGPTLSSSASIATASGTSITAGVTEGSFILAAGLPVVALGPVPSPENLSTQTTVAALGGVTSSAPPSLAIGLLENGEVMLVTVIVPPTGAIVWTTFGGFNSANITAGELTTTAALAAPRALFLTPLFSQTQNGFARFGPLGTSSLATASTFSNTVALVGLGNVIVAPSETNRVSAASLPATDRALALATRAPVQLLPFRAVLDLGNQGTSATSEADPGRMPAESSLADGAVPSPQRFDLITDFMPFDQAAVGETIDQFLQQLEHIGGGLSSLQWPTVVVLALVATGAGLTAWKAVPRALVRSRGEDELAAIDITTALTGISGLPGGSSSEEP